MDVLTILIALALIFLAWKVLSGIIKFGLIAVVILAAVWFVTQGGM